MSSPTPHEMRVVGPELLAPGTVVGRHRIAGKLAEGTHATIYMGEHVETSARVAVKVLRWAFASHPEAIARFNREAHVMGRLALSTNVVHVHDIGNSPDGRRYLVMEFVRGRELSLVLANAKHRGEPMDPARACLIARDIAAALRDAHGKGVVHRDIKPSNIMILREPDGREQGKLVDFGVSSDLDSKGVEPDLTMAGSVIGTAEYMAPEQAVGLPATPAIDIFALGVVLFEMLTSQLPPADALRGGLVPPVSTVRPGLPAALDELVRDCLQYDPSRRPSTAIEVITRLGIVLDELRGRHSGPTKWVEGRPVRAAGAIGSNDDDEIEAEPVVAGAHAHVAASADRSSSPPRSRSSAVVLVVALVLGASAVAAFAAWKLASNDANASSTDEAPTDARSTGGATEAPSAPKSPAPSSPAPAPAKPPEPSETKVATPDVDPTTPSPAEPTPVKPGPSPSTTPHKPGPAKPAAPSSDSPTCVALREAAKRSAGSLAWSDVLRDTAETACWPSSTERLRLRVEALAELGRFADCVRAGGSSKDKKISDSVEWCRKRLDR